MEAPNPFVTGIVSATSVCSLCTSLPHSAYPVAFLLLRWCQPADPWSARRDGRLRLETGYMPQRQSNEPLSIRPQGRQLYIQKFSPKHRRKTLNSQAEGEFRSRAASLDWGSQPLVPQNDCQGLVKDWLTRSQPEASFGEVLASSDS